MRNILFRGKRLDNGEWVEGYLADIITGVQGFEDRAIIVPFGTALAIACDPATVGQYTGLQDKNGKKIFEGDIMSLVTEFGDTIIREIRFIDGAFCVIGEQEDDLHGLSWAVEMCDGIVGDNIHDNPDLLK